MIDVKNPFFDLPNKNPLTCHVFCLPNAPSNSYFTLSHFAQKIRNLCWMLKSTGNKVIYYGYESCDVPCDEKVIVLSEDLLLEAFPNSQSEFGHIDINIDKENPEGVKYLEKVWTLEVGYQAKKRYAPNDFFFWMLPMCGQRDLYEEFQDLPVRHVEPGIGYIGACLPYKVFQSTYIRDFHYGAYHASFGWRNLLGDYYNKIVPNSSPHYLYTNISWETTPPHDAVVPNSYDLSLFDFRVEKEDYGLCLARVLARKGIKQAVEICEKLGMKLIVAGPGDFEAAVGKKPGKNVEVLGPVGVEERRHLLSNARVVFSLSGVHETFGGAAIEALLSGTLPLVANTGGFLDTIQSGYNGYRIPFNNIDAGVEVIKNNRIDPYILRDAGLRFSREQCALKHNAYLQNLDSLLRENSRDPVMEPDWVDYSKKIEWPDGWMTPVDNLKGDKDVEDFCE